MTKQYKPTEVMQVSDVICDNCDESCKTEFASLSATWGYGSHKDGLTWSCDLCEDCADLVKGFIESMGGNVVVNEYI